MFLRFLVVAVVIPGIILYVIRLTNVSVAAWPLISLLLTSYLLFVWLITFIEFQKNELTVLVTTNERVVDIAQLSLFNRQISETSLERVQEVNGSTRGVIGTFLEVGRLEIQTAGSDAPLVMRNVKSPQFTARKILEIQRQSSQRRRTGDLGKRKNDELTARKGEQLSQEDLHKLRSGRTEASPQRKNGDAV